MAYSNNRTIFSPRGDYFAYASSDGCLKIWETSSCVLKQEYIPSSHLSSTCSSLAWGPSRSSSSSPHKKTKKRNVSIAIADLNLIAMGTLTGDVLLYSVVNGDLHSKLSDGHTDVVNGISWFAEEDSLFTCSTDQHIVRWCISEGKTTVKWKAGESAIYSVCVVDTKSLLSAGSSIIWWDLEKMTALKKFASHSSRVFCLLPIILEDNGAKYNYFLSASTGDRVVNVWHLDESSNKAVASFTLPDEPSTLDISGNNIKSQPIRVSIVTKNGVLSIFEHQLNGRIKKPLPPKATVQIACMASDSKKKSQHIPIIAAKFTDDENSCMVSYGNLLKPVFESMELSTFEDETFLIRENKASSTTTVESISKVREPERPSKAKLLAPGYMAAPKVPESVPRKKKRKDDSVNELPMEERLSVMQLSQTSETTVSQTPSIQSMVHLLLQGLQSKDNKLLNTVFSCSDEHLIQNTVRRLPLNSIPLLLPVLHERLTRKEHRNRPCLRWLKVVLSIHLSYLISLQEIDEYIGPVSQLIEAREETFPKMSHFVGFIGVLLSQIDNAPSSSTTDISQTALAVYESGASSDEEEQENNRMDHSNISPQRESHSESSSDSESEDIELPADE